jgi:hypothetical protein
MAVKARRKGKAMSIGKGRTMGGVRITNLPFIPLASPHCIVSLPIVSRFPFKSLSSHPNSSFLTSSPSALLLVQTAQRSFSVPPSQSYSRRPFKVYLGSLVFPSNIANMFAKAFILSSVALLVSAANYDVNVGGLDSSSNPILKFNPEVCLFFNSE